MRCRECGGDIIYRDHEYFCSRCGLVYGSDVIASVKTPDYSFLAFDDSPVRLGTRTRRFYTYREKRIARVFEYIRQYTRGLPKHVYRRAIFLARKNIDRLERRSLLEPFALACVEKAARESGLSILERFKGTPLNRRAKKYMREVLGKPLFDLRAVTEKEILNLCVSLGVNYHDCIQLYRKVEGSLAGHKPKTVAAAVVCIVGGCDRKYVSWLAKVSASSLRSAINKINSKL